MLTSCHTNRTPKEYSLFTSLQFYCISIKFMVLNTMLALINTAKNSPQIGLEYDTHFSPDWNLEMWCCVGEENVLIGRIISQRQLLCLHWHTRTGTEWHLDETSPDSGNICWWEQSLYSKQPGQQQRQWSHPVPQSLAPATHPRIWQPVVQASKLPISPALQTRYILAS